MGFRESMMAIIVRHKLLANQIPKKCNHPLEEWMAIKARNTIKKGRELREEIGGSVPDHITREIFEKYQLYRVREQMKYAEANVPFYRNRFKEAGVRPEDIRTYDDLTKIPLTDPNDLAEKSMLFYGVSATKMLREFTTSGTTGHFKTIGYTSNDLISKIDIVASALRDIGMTKKDSLHVMFPMVIAWDPSLMLVGACNILGYDSSVCSEADIEKQLTTMREAKSTYIIGLPSFIYRVTKLLSKEVDLKTLGIKRIISTSEPLSESMRAQIQDAWGCKVLDVWGMTEFGLACAVECDEQNGLHTDEANMLMEIINPETGEHVPAGEKGELVITALNAEGTVLIRYCTHDIAALLDPPCGCGAHFNKRLVKPSGRMDLQFKIGYGHKVFPVMFDEVLFAIKDVIDYRAEITLEGYHDVLTFYVETDNPGKELEKQIVDAVSSIMAISDGLEEDLVAVPRVKFVDPEDDDYKGKTKKITDLRENYD
ncbi:MAG: phenylacetate--CoA ligase family protein [Candidatus Methanomethylophilaceae archaeon]|nr:phenylacetate--CoA ligase family protein [Candidatus Methanomethylophilaceae archaeon]